MKKSILLLFLSMPIVAFAQTSLSLDEYVSQMEGHNRELQQRKAAEMGAIYNRQIVNGGNLPKLSGNAEYSYNPDNNSDSYGVGATIEQNIYSGGGVKRNMKLADLDIAGKGWQVAIQEQQIRYLAEISYWEGVANSRLCEVADNYLQIVNTLLNLVEKRYEQGAISRTDVLVVEQQQIAAMQRKISAYEALGVTLRQINYNRGAEPDHNLTLSDTLPAPFVPITFATLNEILERSPEYMNAVVAYKSSRMETRIGNSAYIPSVKVGVSGNYSNSDFTPAAYAKLSIPIFHFMERRKVEQKNQMAERSASAQVDKVEEQLALALSNAKLKIIKLEERWSLVNSSLSVATDNLRLNTISYSEGKLPIIDVINAQASWLDSYTNVIQYNYDFMVALGQYSRLVGMRASIE
ncbi:MAG: TolC family protein [Odoribacter sp.]|nr:TolC family protein [Odoribacter sp.]